MTQETVFEEQANSNSPEEKDWLSVYLPMTKELFKKANEGQLAKIHRRTIEEFHSDYVKVINNIGELAGLDTATLLLKDNRYHDLLLKFVKEHHTLCEVVKFMAEKYGLVLIQDRPPTLDENRDLIKNWIIVGEGDLPYRTDHYVAAALFMGTNIDKLRTRAENSEYEASKLRNNLEIQQNLVAELNEQVIDYRSKFLKAQEQLDKHKPLESVDLDRSYFIFNSSKQVWLGLSKNTNLGDGEGPEISDFIKTKYFHKAYSFSSLEEARLILTKIANRKKLSKVKDIEEFSIIKQVFQQFGS